MDRKSNYIRRFYLTPLEMGRRHIVARRRTLAIEADVWVVGGRKGGYCRVRRGDSGTGKGLIRREQLPTEDLARETK